MGKHRDDLIRAGFELERDLNWLKTLEPSYREQGLAAATIASRREAFNQYEEKGHWPWWQNEATRFSNAVLDDMRMDCIDRLDALGLLRWKQYQAASKRERLQQILGTPDREEKPQERSKDRGRGM